jgi:hypothetical protein
MKYIVMMLSLISMAFTVTQNAAATDYAFTYFQCIPGSCQDETLPTVVGSATVFFESACSGGVVNGINGSVSMTIGTPTACHAPYIALALVQTSRTELLDDCGVPYFVDYATESGEIFNASGVVVYYNAVTTGCDNSESTTVHGSRPC